MATYKGKVQIGTLEVDAVVSESTTVQVQVTRNPVEQGAKVADHAQRDADTVTLDFWVSNQPGVPREQVPPDYASRAQAAWDYLDGLASRAELIDVTTPRRIYRKMLVEQLRDQRTPQSGDALHAVVTVRQLRVVENRTVLVLTKKPSGQGLDKRGKQATKPTSAENSKKATGVLKRLADGGAFEIIGIHTTPGSGVAPP